MGFMYTTISHQMAFCASVYCTPNGEYCCKYKKFRGTIAMSLAKFLKHRQGVTEKRTGIKNKKVARK